MEALIKRLVSEKLHTTVLLNIMSGKFKERVTKHKDPEMRKKLQEEVSMMEDYWRIVADNPKLDGNEYKNSIDICIENIEDKDKDEKKNISGKVANGKELT